MREVLISIFACAPSVTATIGAIILAYQGKEGWGWLIFLAICLSPDLKFSRS